MTYNKYNRGSKWRKWDLQVQTILDDDYVSIAEYWDDLKKENPDKCNLLIEKIGSEDDIKKFDSKDYFFTDTSVDKKTKLRNYSKLFLNFIDIFNEDVGTICVTDHNYDHDELLDILVNESNNFKVKILPGVEINIQGVHALVVWGKIFYKKNSFSESIKTFLSKVEINNKKDNGVLTVCNKSYVDVISEINKTDGILIYSHCNSDNGLFQERGKTDRTHLADCFNYQKFNILQTKNKNSADIVRQYILNNLQNLKSKFVITLGSDAGSLRNILQADESSNYCWIKADPTFEGLKQIICEPEERLKIQEVKPEEKENYLIIDKIKFVDDDFTGEEILINQNLTTVIGGKSTGKSILLRNIAKSIDPKEVKRRLNEGSLKDYKENVDGFEVLWKDGQVNKLNENVDVSKKIIYIPQSYLNRLVDKEEDRTSIDEIIKNVLLQDEKVKDAFDEVEKNQRINQQQIAKDLEDLFFIFDDINNQKEKIKLIGDKKGVISEIEKLQVEVDQMKKKAGMSEEEIKNYNDLAEKINSKREQKEIITTDISELENLKELNVFINIDFSNLSDDLKNELGKKLKSQKEIFYGKWHSDINAEVRKLKAKIVAIEKDEKDLFENINPLLAKVKQAKSLDEKAKKLEKEKDNLKEIQKEEDKLKKLQNDIGTKFKRLKSLHESFYNIYFNGKTKVLKQALIKGDLSFDLKINFRTNYFKNTFIEEVLNLNYAKNLKGYNLIDDNSGMAGYNYKSPTDFHNDVEKTIKGILNGDIILKTNYTAKQAITKLLQNWFIFDYKIAHNGDDISTMSQGNKSFVLLKLLIELDNSKCPIFIDQPEDDLDNRSIYNDLVRFIKSKKKERQIIIATHNANLVVGADAEEVIVANQQGNKTPNKQYAFEYVSGSLEYTFKNEKELFTLYRQGIQEHVCDILEGGKKAFQQRKNKYNFIK